MNTKSTTTQAKRINRDSVTFYSAVTKRQIRGTLKSLWDNATQSEDRLARLAVEETTGIKQVDADTREYLRQARVTVDEIITKLSELLPESDA